METVPCPACSSPCPRRCRQPLPAAPRGLAAGRVHRRAGDPTRAARPAARHASRTRPVAAVRRAEPAGQHRGGRDQDDGVLTRWPPGCDRRAAGPRAPGCRRRSPACFASCRRGARTFGQQQDLRRCSRCSTAGASRRLATWRACPTRRWPRAWGRRGRGQRVARGEDPSRWCQPARGADRGDADPAGPSRARAFPSCWRACSTHRAAPEPARRGGGPPADDLPLASRSSYRGKSSCRAMRDRRCCELILLPSRTRPAGGRPRHPSRRAGRPRSPSSRVVARAAVPRAWPRWWRGFGAGRRAGGAPRSSIPTARALAMRPFVLHRRGRLCTRITGLTGIWAGTPVPLGLAIRRFRLPIAARVMLKDGRPARITTERRGRAATWSSRRRGRGARRANGGLPVRNRGQPRRSPERRDQSRVEGQRQEGALTVTRTSRSPTLPYRFPDRATERWFVDGIIVSGGRPQGRPSLSAICHRASYLLGLQLRRRLAARGWPTVPWAWYPPSP